MPKRETPKEIARQLGYLDSLHKKEKEGKGECIEIEVDDDGKAVRVGGVSPDVIKGTGSLSHLPRKYGPDSPLDGTIYRELGRDMEKEELR